MLVHSRLDFRPDLHLLGRRHHAGIPAETLRWRAHTNVHIGAVAAAVHLDESFGELFELWKLHTEYLLALKLNRNSRSEFTFENQS